MKKYSIKEYPIYTIIIQTLHFYDDFRYYVKLLVSAK